jgi:peptide-methionine (R)-S-oxide reductase
MTDTDTRNISASGFDLSPPSEIERKRLEATLTREERDVLLHHGTEAPFCGGLLDNKQDGVYCCRLCGLPLFLAKTKFESGTGWPSFFAPFDAAHVTDVKDTRATSFPMGRHPVAFAIASTRCR